MVLKHFQNGKAGIIQQLTIYDLLQIYIHLFLPSRQKYRGEKRNQNANYILD